MNTALNRTSVALLTNKSGGSVAQGDVVIVDSANATAFTTTTTSGFSTGSVGVVLEPNGIASNATGTVAFGGYVPLVNLSSSASLGDLFHTHSVAKQALRHASPVVAGDFGQVLGTGTAPAAFLWSTPAQTGSVALTTASNLLSGDVSMPTANTYYDGPSLSLVAGTWFLIGGVVCTNASSQTDFTAKLWDGTTVYSSGQTATRAAGPTVGACVPLGGVVTPGTTTTYKISATGDNATSVLRAACQINGAGNNASYLYAVKIA